MPKITIIKIIHFTIDFLLAGFHRLFDLIFIELERRKKISETFYSLAYLDIHYK